MVDGIRVLYVDDEPGLLEIAKIFLEETGEFIVSTSTSAKEALTSQSLRSHDIIVSDYQMPGMDGIAFLKEIRKRYDDLPFILFTGRGREEVVIQAINNGADFYLQKGGDPRAQFAELSHKIRQAVRRRVVERDLQLIFKNMINAFVVWESVFDENGRYVSFRFGRFNDAYARIAKVKREEVMGKDVFEVWPATEQSWVEVYGSVATTGIPRVFDMYHEPTKGWYHCNAYRPTDSPAQICVVFEDITEHRQDEAELHAAYEQVTAAEEELRSQFNELSATEQRIRESEAKYRDLADFLPQMIFETDQELKITYINRHALRVFGLTPEDPVHGRSVLSFIDPSQHNQVKEHIRRILDNKSSDPTEYTAIKKDKSTFTVLVYASPLSRNTKPAGFRGVMIDISSQKKIEEGLRESESKFRSIFENSPYPIAINSLPDNRFLEVNKAFLDISGFTESEILGKDPVGLGLLSLTEAARLIAQRLLTGKIENVPLALTAKGRRQVHVLFSSLPVTIHNKPALVTLTAETTKLKRVEEELLKRNEELHAANEDLSAAGEELRQQYDELSSKEEVLRKSEEKLRALIELSLEGILITDFLGNILFLNRALGQIVDVPEYEAAIGKRNVMEFIAPESQPDVLRDFANVAGGMDTYLASYKLITETKREVWVESIGKRIPFGGTIAMLISLRDITGQKRAEDAIRESEQKFATVFRKSPVALTLASAADGKFLDVNDTFSKGSGYSRDEVVGRKADELGIFVDRREYEQFTSAIRSRGTVRGMELKCREKSGEIQTCRFSSGIVMMGGRPHILSSVEDVTDQKKSAEALRESEEKFRKIFETSPIAMTLVTPEFRFYSVNPAFIAMTGYSEEELLKMSFKDITHPDYLAGDLIHMQELAAGKIPVYSTEKQYIMKDNTLIRGLIRVIPLRDQEGSLRYFAAQIEDITDRKRDEEALRQANKKLNLLSGITRHDIKNQLLVLDGYIALLHKKIPDPAYKDSFSRITEVSNLIANLIQFTKEYEMVGVHAPAWQDISTLAGDAGRGILTGNVTLKNDLPAGTEVFADPLITRVFFNLVDNAVRHGGKINNIRFSLEARDGDNIIVCTDDGDGVRAEEKELIFTMGYGKNTGFGLAISREILDITGITIRETGKPGKGARFEIAVPKSQIRSRS